MILQEEYNKMLTVLKKDEAKYSIRNSSFMAFNVEQQLMLSIAIQKLEIEDFEEKYPEFVV